jgi:hypothetical protein
MADLAQRYMEFSGNIPPLTADLGAIRKYILQQMVSKKSSLPNLTKDWCWNSWFYPEYFGVDRLRERFIKCANDHANLKQTDEKQIIFFSLNGYFDWNQAASSAKTHTTCALFVRACRAALLVLESKNKSKNWATNTPDGTDACIIGPGNVASIKWEQRGGRVPQPGDIFHINKPGTNRDHVGIIVRHTEATNGDWQWRTVEGGQGAGCETYAFDRTLPLKSGKRMMGDRQLIKWIDFGKMADAATKQKWGAMLGY